MIKIAPTPDEAYEICNKHALNCAIGRNGYWSSGRSFESTGGSASFGSYSGSPSFNSIGSSSSSGEDSSSFGSEGSSSFNSGTTDYFGHKESGSFSNSGSNSLFHGAATNTIDERTMFSSGQTNEFGIRGDAYERGRI